MNTPRGSRDFVIDEFHTKIVKRLLLKTFTVHNFEKLLRTTWVQSMTPHHFVRHMLQEKDFSVYKLQTEEALQYAGRWIVSFRNKLFNKAFKKCVQILVEYGELLLPHTLYFLRFKNIFK